MPALTDLSFEAFVEFQFGHAVGAHPWQLGIDADWWEPEPRTGIAYLTRLFLDGRSVLCNCHSRKRAKLRNGCRLARGWLNIKPSVLLIFSMDDAVK